jgi:hypothetical protein
MMSFSSEGAMKYMKRKHLGDVKDELENCKFFFHCLLLLIIGWISPSILMSPQNIPANLNFIIKHDNVL